MYLAKAEVQISSVKNRKLILPPKKEHRTTRRLFQRRPIWNPLRTVRTRMDRTWTTVPNRTVNSVFTPKTPNTDHALQNIYTNKRRLPRDDQLFHCTKILTTTGYINGRSARS